MHELTLCQSILDIALRNVPGDAQIRAIYLEIGKLTLIDKNALLFSFDLIAKGTRAADAKINLIEIEGKARCQHCHYVFKLLYRYDPCNRCGNYAIDLLEGTELRVKSMEVEPCAESADAVKM